MKIGPVSAGTSVHSRSIKRDIGHLCRDEVVPSNGPGSSRNRQGRKTSETVVGQTPVFARTSQEIHPHELKMSSAQRANIPSLEHDMSASQTFSPDALSASRLSTGYTAANEQQFGMAPQFPPSQDVPLVSPNKTRSMDPNLSFFRPMHSMQPTVGTPHQLDQLAMSPTQPMFGAPPLAQALRNDKPSNMQGSQLGGTAWLGLGGAAGRLSIAGDSGGGGELNVLSEFLESLDDSAPWYSNTEKPVSHNTDALGFPYKQDAPPAVGAALQRTSSAGTTNLLNTPPSMVDQDSMSLDADTSSLTDPSGGLSLLSPQQAMLRNAPHSPYRYGRKGPANEGEGDTHASLSLTEYGPPPPASAHTGVQEAERPESKMSTGSSEPYPPSLTHDTSKTERFLLTAADQTDGSRDERLRKVIQAKYEAGLLRPYNHVNGYARLNRWMEQNVSASSRRRILKPLSVFRPVFYSIAKKLTNYDLIYIEEAFERLLLDYDRVFSIQSIPACLWRRTGEIYKGNKEFAELVGVSIESLREGRLCIYELMAEESAVNYWEKYGSVSFDPSQKAVLTMCKLRTKNRGLAKADVAAAQKASGAGERPADAHPEASEAARQEQSTDADVTPTEEQKQAPCITCCFSFTIRRDKWNVCLNVLTHQIPTMIVGVGFFFFWVPSC